MCGGNGTHFDFYKNTGGTLEASPSYSPLLSIVTWECSGVAVFALEEYDPAPSVELLCAICRMVLTNPEECPCRHVFCSRCIREWLGKVQPPTCPMCRVEIETTTLVPVLPLVRSLLDRLTVLHTANEGRGMLM